MTSTVRSNIDRRPFITAVLAGGIIVATAFLMPMPSHAQVAGSTVLGAAVAEVRSVAMGWSATHTILGKDVYNDKDEKIGKIDDLIVDPEKSISYAILNVGGLFGVFKHDVSVPVNEFKLVAGNKLILPGASRDTLKNSPVFNYE